MGTANTSASIHGAIARLAILYPKPYHLLFTQSLPLFLVFEDLLSVRKKKYSVTRETLRCYVTYRGSLQQIKE